MIKTKIEKIAGDWKVKIKIGNQSFLTVGWQSKESAKYYKELIDEALKLEGEKC